MAAADFIRAFTHMVILAPGAGKIAGPGANGQTLCARPKVKEGLLFNGICLNAVNTRSNLAID
jgi:hypothetical protein